MMKRKPIGLPKDFSEDALASREFGTAFGANFGHQTKIYLKDITLDQSGIW
jgi:hypothetical protein